MIAIFGILFELLIGIPVGIISALKQYSMRDRAFTVFSLIGVSMPYVPPGMLLLYFFAFRSRCFPTSRPTRGRFIPCISCCPGSRWV